MQEGSKKISGQAEKGKETTTAKADKSTKASVQAEVKAEPVKSATEPKKADTKKEEPVKKAEPKKAEGKKEEPKKEAVKKEPAAVKVQADKASKKEKKAKDPVVPEVVLQFDDNGAQEADLANVVAKIKAAYVAEGHRESSIKALRIYLKPQDWKAYYVINNKIEGQIDLF